MVVAVKYDPAEQAKRRRRERISQSEIAARLKCAISKVSEYEVHGNALPWEMTGADYEKALAEAIVAKHKAAK